MARGRKSWGGAVQDRVTQRDLKTDILYETAARHFTHRGFHGTSLTEIADDLGVTKAALYHYVSGKQELLYKLHDISLDLAEQARARGVAEGKDSLSRFWLTCYYYILGLVRSPTACMVMMDEDALSPEHGAEIIGRRRKLDQGMQELILAGAGDGSVAVHNAKMAGLVVVGALNWLPRWYDPKGVWSAEEIAASVSDQLAQSIASGPESLAGINRPQTGKSPA